MAKFLFRESFDTYTDNREAPTGILSRWTMSSHSPGLAPGRFLGRSLALEWSDRFFRALDDYASQMTLGFSFKQGSLPSFVNDGAMAGFFNDNLQGLSFLGVQMDGSMTMMRKNGRDDQATQLCRSEPGVIQPGVWNFIEWEVGFSDTDGFGRVYLNGDPVPIMECSGVDTVAAGNTQARYLHMGGYGAGTSSVAGRLYDDVYIWDEPIRRGPIRIESLPVNGNGAHQDFTPSEGSDNAACIDEIVPNISDYVIGTGVGQYDEYTMANLSSSSADVFEVNLIMLGQQTGSTIRAMALGLNSGGTVSDGEDIYMGSGFARYERRLLKDPNGNINWTKASVDALILRPKITV